MFQIRSQLKRFRKSNEELGEQYHPASARSRRRVGSAVGPATSTATTSGIPPKSATALSQRGSIMSATSRVSHNQVAPHRGSCITPVEGDEIISPSDPQTAAGSGTAGTTQRPQSKMTSQSNLWFLDTWFVARYLFTQTLLESIVASARFSLTRSHSRWWCWRRR